MPRTYPNYRLIYNDIISRNHPNKQQECNNILTKREISILDVITLNNIIFGLHDKETVEFNQKHRSYDQNAILEILEYQQKNELNNTELANHFKLSRNTVAKWKKYFNQKHLHSVTI
ncbi:helix-turn-helix domain-containing protein [Chryseobacterium sp. MYb264]|uniref:helix-turn-helix domain-containing protein n=1 Tax=Chryseobacterium sp. MYb264 TaxID=2745153 RepID=UPI002E10730B|nr:helix-turn-helix domain-containing protein [Chryseobacterium sp. MYb264]